jgi:hypothetical protein
MYTESPYNPSEIILVKINGEQLFTDCSIFGGHYATSQKVAGSIPVEVIGFFDGPNPSSRTMALGSTQPLREMSTRKLPGGKERSAREADNLTAICEAIVYKMWDPRRLTTL